MRLQSAICAAVTTITRTITVAAAAGVFAPGHLGELTRIVPFELADGRPGNFRSGLISAQIAPATWMASASGSPSSGQIAQAHGAALTVRPRPGGGLRAGVSFPHQTPVPIAMRQEHASGSAE